MPLAVSPVQEVSGSRDEVLAYRFPTEMAPELVDRLDSAFVGPGESFRGCDVSPCLFEMLCRLRGMEGAILDLAASPSTPRSLAPRRRA